MGSTVMEIDCVRCGSDQSHEDYNYKTGELSTFCRDCGAYEHIYIKKNEDGSFFLKNPDRGFGNFNLIWINEKNFNTIGAYNLMLKDGGGVLNCLIDENDVDEIKSEFESDPKYTELIISIFIDGKIKKYEYRK